MNSIIELQEYYNKYNSDFFFEYLKTFESKKQIYFNSQIKNKYNSIYGSYIYSHILSKHSIIKPIELLAGDSIDFIFSLSLKNQTYNLARLDKRKIDNYFLKNFNFTSIHCSLEKYIPNLRHYDFIVCNHIIDDLIVDFVFKDKELNKFYSDIKLSPLKWGEIYQNYELIHKINIYINNLFKKIIDVINSKTVIVLFEYPSTFAFKSKDINRVKLRNLILKYCIRDMLKNNKIKLEKVNLLSLGFNQLIEKNTFVYELTKL